MKLIEDITTSDLESIVRDVNSWDGSLSDYCYEDIDDLSLILEGKDATEILMVFAGGKQNVYDPYWQLNAYGHLNTYSEYAVQEALEYGREEILERLLELAEEGNTYVDYEQYIEEEEEEA